MGASWGSAERNEFSRYHAEAAVVAEHCLAPTFEQTRWPERPGRFSEAETFLQRARDGAPTKAEREIFALKLKRCQAQDAAR